MIYLYLIVILWSAMRLYLLIAQRYQITDSPGLRSSHHRDTISGAGIIYLIAGISVLFFNSAYALPIVGLLFIGIVSFIDDNFYLSQKIRLFTHLLAVSVLFYSLNLFNLIPIWGMVLIYILVIGVINAYNFMDGINGITGAYSLVVLGGLQYVNLKVTSFVDPYLIWAPLLATLIFLFYNFRPVAKCFAGDVGSISLAFWVVWLLMTLILKTNNPTYILFLAIYGIDSILTIFHRLMRREDIFQAHRLHFYQLLVNERRWPHLVVSAMYATLQLLIILVVLSDLSPTMKVLISLVPGVIAYLRIKPRLMRIET